MGAKAKRSAQETAQLEEGEYLDESPSVFLSEPLWSAERTRRFQGQDGTIVDEIMELEVSKETRLETEAQLSRRLDEVSGKIGVDFQTDEASESAKESGLASHLRSDNEQFAKITSFVQGLDLAATTAKPAAEPVTMPQKISHNERQSQLAFTKLQQIRAEMSGEFKIFKNVEIEDLRQSHALRTLILDFDFTHIMSDPAPKASFKRTYRTQMDEEVA